MKRKISPYLLIILGFLTVILLGTGLLLLPFATKSGYQLSFVDALFTATSAVCVTGLVSVESIASVFSVFGKTVIILLIEIGGLGFVTVAIFVFTLIGLKIGIQDRFLIKESLNQNSLKGMVKLVRITVFTTLIIQTIGALINFIVFRQEYPFWQALGVSFFHSISAFNNAGFDIFTNGNSMIGYQDNVLLSLNTAFLIILGGIGFIVIYDVLRKKKWKLLSIHSKIVIKTTLFLIVFGTLIVKIFEQSNVTWLQAFFSSVAARTAGFAVVDFTTFTTSSLLIIMMLMFIGASPASTGGGVKTTTFFTITKYITSFSLGKAPVVYNRHINNNSIIKAFILVVLSIVYIAIIIVLISFIERFNLGIVENNYQVFTKITFEVFSAFGTVGNSMGITANLHSLSKLLLAVTMFFGRLGPITILSSWNKHWNVDPMSKIKYVDERIIIG